MTFNFLENKLLKSIQLGVKNGLINEGFDLDDFDLDDLNDITIKKTSKSQIKQKIQNLEDSNTRNTFSISKLFPIYFSDIKLKKFDSAKLISNKKGGHTLFDCADEFRLYIGAYRDRGNYANVKKYDENIKKMLNLNLIQEMFDIKKLQIYNIARNELFKKKCANAIIFYILNYNFEEFNIDNFAIAFKTYNQFNNLYESILFDCGYKNYEVNQLEDIHEEDMPYYEKIQQTIIKDYNDIIKNKDVVEFIKNLMPKNVYSDDEADRQIVFNQIYHTPDKGLYIVNIDSNRTLYDCTSVSFLSGYVQYQKLIDEHKESKKVYNGDDSDFIQCLKKNKVATRMLDSFMTKIVDIKNTNICCDESDPSHKALCVFFNCTEQHNSSRTVMFTKPINLYRKLYSIGNKYLSEKDYDFFKPITCEEAYIHNNKNIKLAIIINNELLVSVINTELKINDISDSTLKSYQTSQVYGNNSTLGVMLIEDIRSIYDKIELTRKFKRYFK